MSEVGGVNSNKPGRWKDDIARSVDFYNDWFLRFAPKAYCETRQKTTVQVEAALKWTRNLGDISPELLRAHPEVLPMLRMATAPPIARDRLIGLAGVSRNLVSSMEDHGKVPLRQCAIFSSCAATSTVGISDTRRPKASTGSGNIESMI